MANLNELYCRTRHAQVEAERSGFTGTAAALAGMADALALEFSVSSSMARDVAGHGSVADAVGPGERLTRH